jgi:hypothetical protein
MFLASIISESDLNEDYYEDEPGRDKFGKKETIH